MTGEKREQQPVKKGCQPDLDLEERGYQPIKGNRDKPEAQNPPTGGSNVTPPPKKDQ